MIYKLTAYNAKDKLQGEFHFDNAYAWGSPEETRVHALIEMAADRGHRVVLNSEREMLTKWDYSDFPDGFAKAQEVIAYIVENCDVQVEVRQIEKPEE